MLGGNVRAHEQVTMVTGRPSPTITHSQTVQPSSLFHPFGFNHSKFRPNTITTNKFGHILTSNKECSGVSVFHKAAKLAAVENARPLLAPPYSEPEDSGIDSDDTSLLRAALSLQISEESSCSDEDVSDKSWALTHMNKEEPLKGMMAEEGESLIDVLIRWKGQKEDPVCESSLEDVDRSSPPLYEVELTASDEDDDGSVLELVIPMQSRYQRVPTSSPKKGKMKSQNCFNKLFCCFRK